MAFRFLALALLSLTVTVNIVAAGPSAAEIALRNAISAPEEETTFVLTKSIVLTRDLPPIPFGKILTVESAAISGAPFTIDGAKKYLIFHNSDLSPFSEAKLTLKNLIITRGKFAAVDIVGVADEASLWLENVRFVNNPRALNLKFAAGTVTGCRFSGSTKSAVVIRWDDGPIGRVAFDNCIFSDNTAEKGRGGGAIRASIFSRFAIDKCTFSKNSADTYGGALYMEGVSPDIKRSVFKGNKAKLSGGAIYGSGTSLDVFSTTFDGNVANKPGGAFVLDGGSDFSFCSCKFSRNIGAKVASNGYVIGTGSITTDVGVTIPAITVAPTAVVTFATSDPCFLYP